MRKIRVEIRGPEGDYWRCTIRQWCLEVKDLLEQEYGIELVVVERDEDGEISVFVEGEEAFSGVPGEEGYLLELLKSKIERVLRR